MTHLIDFGVLGAAVAFIAGVFVTRPRTPSASLKPAPTAPSSPQTHPTPPPAPKLSKIETVALAQKEFEGWFPGSSSYRHNNPGNCKDLNGNFLTFPTPEAGLMYLANYIHRVALGLHHAYPKGGNTTIEEYTHIYTSDPEPSPTNYAACIVRHLTDEGYPVSTTTTMGSLLS